MKKLNKLDVLSAVLWVAGTLITVISSKVTEKQSENILNDKIEKALAKALEKK